MKTIVPYIEPGARWLRCDLHVHTPFDGEKKFGEDVRGAMDAFRNAKPQRLAENKPIASCRHAGTQPAARGWIWLPSPTTTASTGTVT